MSIKIQGDVVIDDTKNFTANTVTANGTNLLTFGQAAFNKANLSTKTTASNTAPTSNTVGDLWLSLTDDTLYQYTYDGTSNNWIDISGPILRSNQIVVDYTITANAS